MGVLILHIQNIKFNYIFKLIIALIIVIILGFLLFLTIPNNQLLNMLNNGTSKLNINDDTSSTRLKLESKEDNDVLLIFEDTNGIFKITAPNGLEIIANGKESVALDYDVEKNMTYTFEIINTKNLVSYISFITPVSHIEIAKTDFNIDLNNVQESIYKDLNHNLIATNFVNVSIGEQNYMDSNQTQMSEVFYSWNSFGDGNWSYNSSSKTILNSKNSSYVTGYYYPDGNYDDIELSFNAMTTNGDDDIIGAMIRFNQNSENDFSSYLFLLDRHDNGGGIGNGAYNGLNKIVNNNLLNGSGITYLSVNPSLRWERSKWQNYKMIAKGNLIEAYIDNKLVAQTTDSSISSGTYGFLSWSQANTYFKDILIRTRKSLTLSELIEKITWNNIEINVAINFNNSYEDSLNSSNLQSYFIDNNIHYIGVSNEINRLTIENFIDNINDNGNYIDSTNYNTYYNEIIKYLLSILSVNN